MNVAEGNYRTRERELLAMIHALKDLETLPVRQEVLQW